MSSVQEAFDKSFPNNSTIQENVKNLLDQYDYTQELIPLSATIRALGPKVVLIGYQEGQKELAEKVVAIAKSQKGVEEVHLVTIEEIEGGGGILKPMLRYNMEAAGLDRKLVFLADLGLQVNKDGKIITVRCIHFPTGLELQAV